METPSRHDASPRRSWGFHNAAKAGFSVLFLPPPILRSGEKKIKNKTSGRNAAGEPRRRTGAGMYCAVRGWEGYCALRERKRERGGMGRGKRYLVICVHLAQRLSQCLACCVSTIREGYHDATVCRVGRAWLCLSDGLSRCGVVWCLVCLVWCGVYARRCCGTFIVLYVQGRAPPIHIPRCAPTCRGTLARPRTTAHTVLCCAVLRSRV